MKKIILTALLFCFIVAEDEFFEPATSLGGYGEMHFDMEANDGDGKLDFHRFIFYIKHQFSPKWSMMSEIEIEHNMVGSSEALGYKGGYVAMEQAHLNYWNGSWGFRGGVLLVPAGIINEYHEPPTFLSVERPEYNKYIIPTTWFDNGFAFYGNMGDFGWNVTFTGDLDGDDIGKGIRSAREKGHYSTASNWTKTFQGSYTGIAGVKIGGSMTMNDAPRTDEGFEGTTVGVNLMEFNGTYMANNIFARFEYGKIDYTDNPDGYESSSGYYLDLGYDIGDLVGCGEESNLYVWTRMSNYNRTDVDGDENEISLFGVTYKPINNITFKFETGTKNDDDIMRVGLGYMF